MRSLKGREAIFTIAEENNFRSTLHVFDSDPRIKVIEGESHGTQRSADCRDGPTASRGKA